MSRDTLKQLEDETLVALCIDGEAWPRGLLSESPIPDAWMGLVTKADGRRRFVPAGEDPRAERGEKLLLVRNRAIAVPLEVSDCPAARGNLVSGACELLLRWQAREDDLAALQRLLLGAGPLTLQRLTEAVADAGGLNGLRDFARRRPAEELLREDTRDELLSALREELKRFAFDAGVEIQRVAKIGFSSETFERKDALRRETQQRVERIKAAEMVETATLAATNRRLDDLGDLLDKLKTAAAGDETSGTSYSRHSHLVIGGDCSKTSGDSRLIDTWRMR